jgi:hypothetical protein
MSESEFPTAVMVRIVGEPFLARAKQFKADTIATDAAWTAFGKERGALEFWSGSRLGAIKFPGPPPEGWGKPKQRGRDYGFSYPLKGGAEAEALSALPAKPNPQIVFGDALVRMMSHHDRGDPKGSYGSGCIGTPWMEWVGWTGDNFYGRIPHAGNAVKSHLADFPNDVVEEPAARWTMPDGLELISQARYDLELAQHKVAAEEAAARGK